VRNVKKSHKRLIGIGGAAVIIILIVFGAQQLAPTNLPADDTGPAYSYVFAFDWASGENLEDLIQVSILVNDKELTDPNEINDFSNYKNEISAKMPEDIKVDLSDYDYAIFIINPNEATEGYWTREYQVYDLNGNANFTFYPKHKSTDIYGSVLDRDSGAVWTGATNGNYSIYLWFPFETTTERHQGAKWVISDVIADLSAKTLKKLNNEKYWRSRPTVFDMNDDQADHERTGDYLTITETTSIEFDFNDTIGAADSVTGLNITVDSDINFMVEYGAGANADKLYIVFLETWGTVYKTFSLDFEIDMGANLTCSNVKVGDHSIPGRYFNDVAPTFTSLQTLV